MTRLFQHGLMVAASLTMGLLAPPGIAQAAGTYYDAGQINALIDTPTLEMKRYSAEGELVEHQRSSLHQVDVNPLGSLAVPFLDGFAMPALYDHGGSASLTMSMPIVLGSPSTWPFAYNVFMVVNMASSGSGFIEGAMSAWRGDELVAWRDVSHTLNGAQSGNVEVWGEMIDAHTTFDRIDVTFFIKEAQQPEGTGSIKLALHQMSFSTTPVPEPTSIAMMLIGCVALGALAVTRPRS